MARQIKNRENYITGFLETSRRLGKKQAAMERLLPSGFRASESLSENNTYMPWQATALFSRMKRKCLIKS